jgi:hypothetical protein
MKTQKSGSSILEFAGGAILERADYELKRIIDNIRDPNTRADKKRTLTLTIEFLPNFERDNIRVNCTAKSKIEPTSPINTQVYLTENGEDEIVAVEAVPQIPGQMDFDGGEQETPKFIVIRNEKGA